LILIGLGSVFVSEVIQVDPRVELIYLAAFGFITFTVIAILLYTKVSEIIKNKQS